MIGSIIMGGAALANTIVGGVNANKQAKKDLENKKKLKRKQHQKAGADIFGTVDDLAAPEYDDNPYTPNTRELYATGGNGLWGEGKSFKDFIGSKGGVSGISSAANSVANLAFMPSANKRMAENREFDLNSVDVTKDASTFIRDAEVDRAYADPSRIKPIQYGNGGGAKGRMSEKDILANSSNTAMIKAGTHESGKDVEFTRPDGTKASVEGGEGMMDTGNDVNIYSNRLVVPGTDRTYASTFSEISSLKGNREEAKMKTGDAIVSNSKDREIEGDNRLLEDLFNSQESYKKLNNASNTEDQYADGGSGYDPLGLFKRNKLTVPDSFKGTMPDIDADGRTAFESTDIRYDNEASPVIDEFSDDAKVDAKPEKMKRAFVNPNVANAAMTGMTLLDNIYNQSLINDMDFSDPRYASQIELDKDIDTSGQEHAINKQLGNFYKNVDDNVTSSTVGLNMKLAATVQGMDKMSQVHTQANAQKTNIANQEVMANAGIDKFNVAVHNRNMDRDHAKVTAKSANFTNMIDDLTSGAERYMTHARDKEAFAASELNYADTGVILKNFDQGVYANNSYAEVKALLDKGRNAGNISETDYNERMKKLKASKGKS